MTSFENLEDSKNLNICLASAIFLLMLITVFELAGDVLRAYGVAFTPWLQKVTILIVLYLFLRIVANNHRYLRKVEAFLLIARKKK